MHKPVFFKLKVIIIFLLSILFSCAHSHEFWLEPENFNSTSEKSIIHIKIGTKFNGSKFGFKKKFKDKLYKENFYEGKNELNQKDGSFPAFTFNISDKFNIITYVNRFNFLKYRSLKGFENFLSEQNLTEIIKNYDRDKIPTEYYKRFAKTIINYNSDNFFVQKPTLDFEIIVLNKKKNLAELALFKDGDPLKNWPVEIFSKDIRGVVFSKKTKTNNKGIFDINLIKNRTYLVNSVTVFSTEEKPELNLNADWISYWASLTFQN